MNTLTKALLGTGAAAAALVSTASPALARDRDGIDLGDIIAGAVILGGIATVAGAIGNNRDRGYSYGYPYDGYGNDRYGYNDRYDRYGYRSGNPRQAVEQCVRTAERYASRYSYGGRADVTDIRDIDRTRRGYTVRGRIAVNTQGRGYRYGDRNYGRGWDNDYRGWNDSLRGYDAGSFRCRVEYGRVTDIDIDGIRGL
ncbi:MAG: hypothetical protein LC648_05920 [Novosphingobium sp.]|nr:hypothetical protein [Novosphingobium sp.]